MRTGPGGAFSLGAILGAMMPVGPSPPRTGNQRRLGLRYLHTVKAPNEGGGKSFLRKHPTRQIHVCTHVSRSRTYPYHRPVPA